MPDVISKTIFLRESDNLETITNEIYDFLESADFEDCLEEMPNDERITLLDKMIGIANSFIVYAENNIDPYTDESITVDRNTNRAKFNEDNCFVRINANRIKT
jgi:hypothetical protein